MADQLDVLFSAAEIQSKVIELASKIDAAHEGHSVHLIGVLKGSLHFVSDLGRAMKRETTVDFIQVSSYLGEKSSSGVVRIRKDLDVNIEGQHVVIVEDIVDTGTTLGHLRELLGTRKPASLSVVALLSKPESRKIDVKVEFIGFEIPNEFVVGYGLDYAERYRNLPFIAILREN